MTHKDIVCEVPKDFGSKEKLECSGFLGQMGPKGPSFQIFFLVELWAVPIGVFEIQGGGFNFFIFATTWGNV